MGVVNLAKRVQESAHRDGEDVQTSRPERTASLHIDDHLIVDEREAAIGFEAGG